MQKNLDEKTNEFSRKPKKTKPGRGVRDSS